MAFQDADLAGRLRLHVRIDERAASFAALGLAKASRRPVAILCTSGTAAANFHPAVIEAAESGVPLLVLTADRPPELRGAGASQTIDQVKLYGSAVRWYADPGVPERVRARSAYWRSLACQAWAQARPAGTFPGPVHLNLPFRDPLVPDGTIPDSTIPGSTVPDGAAPDGPGTGVARVAGRPSRRPAVDPARVLVGWAALVPALDRARRYRLRRRRLRRRAAARPRRAAGWPVLAEPSSNARRGPNALTAYQYLLAVAGVHGGPPSGRDRLRGRPGLSRPQTALLRTPGVPACRHRAGAGPLGRPRPARRPTWPLRSS